MPRVNCKQSHLESFGSNVPNQQALKGQASIRPVWAKRTWRAFWNNVLPKCCRASQSYEFLMVFFLCTSENRSQIPLLEFLYLGPIWNAKCRSLHCYCEWFLNMFESSGCATLPNSIASYFWFGTETATGLSAGSVPCRRTFPARIDLFGVGPRMK